MDIIRPIIIIILSIVINSMSYYYLIDKHKDDKKKKEDFTFIKSLTMYSVSILVFVLVVVAAYLINIFALDMFNEVLLVAMVIISYLIPIVVSFVHSNMAVEYILLLTREKDKSNRLITIIIQNIVILVLSFISLYAFVPLLDYGITNILRIIMLIAFILSFTLVIIYKESKPIIKEKMKERKAN